MTPHRRCHYCGRTGAKIRRPGEPATCWTCSDLPARDREQERQLELELDRYYEGAHAEGRQRRRRRR